MCLRVTGTQCRPCKPIPRSPDILLSPAAHMLCRAGSMTRSTESTAMGESRLEYWLTTLLLSDLHAHGGEHACLHGECMGRHAHGERAAPCALPHCCASDLLDAACAPPCNMSLRAGDMRECTAVAAEQVVKQVGAYAHGLMYPHVLPLECGVLPAYGSACRQHSRCCCTDERVPVIEIHWDGY